MVLGYPLVDGPSFVALGDSIFEGFTDSTGTQGAYGNGMACRSMHQADFSNPKPCINLARAGVQSSAFTGGTKWKPYLAYGNTALEECGTNDISVGGVNAATIQSRLATLWALIRAGGISNIIRTKLLTSTSSAVGLISAYSVSAGGTGYPATSSFDLTLTGGTLASPGTASVVNVRTNASGVAIAINSVTTLGAYAGAPSVPCATTGSTGSGCTLGCSFAGYFNAANQIANAGYGVGQTCTLVNNWLDTKLADGSVQALVQMNSLRDQGDVTKWLTNGVPNYPTTDGLHPTPTLYEFAAVEIRPALGVL